MEEKYKKYNIENGFFSKSVYNYNKKIDIQSKKIIIVIDIDTIDINEIDFNIFIFVTRNMSYLNCYRNCMQISSF